MSGSLSKIKERISKEEEKVPMPKNLIRCSSFIDSSPIDAICCKRFSASLRLPEELIDIRSRAAPSIKISSSLAIIDRWLEISLWFILLKSNLWHLEIIVNGRASTSVVARIITTFSGGSSKSFKKACCAGPVSP